jgi:hypothetical protein
MLTPRKLIKRIHKRYRVWKLRELYQGLYDASSEKDREILLNSWWTRGLITMSEDYELSRAAGIWRRVHWFERQTRVQQTKTTGAIMRSIDEIKADIERTPDTVQFLGSLIRYLAELQVAVASEVAVRLGGGDLIIEEARRRERNDPVFHRATSAILHIMINGPLSTLDIIAAAKLAHESIEVMRRHDITRNQAEQQRDIPR